MFAPADWDDDLPDVPDFTPISKKKNGMFKGTENTSETRNEISENYAKKVKQQICIQTQESKKGKNAKKKIESDIGKNGKQNMKRKKVFGIEKNEISAVDDYDEVIISKKKKEMYAPIKPEELETVLFQNSKTEKKKNTFKKILENSFNRRTIRTSSQSLREKMLKRLKAAQFRYINEKLYMSESKEAKDLFKEDPNAFKVYHDGYRQQVRKWPVNPLEIIIKKVRNMPKDTKVADLGCGEAMLAQRVPQKVRSFDLVAMNDAVEVCDMAHTPLLTGEMDVAVYCLALMGTNLKDYIIEANRILKVGGLMKIAEVESRFDDVNVFVKMVESYGFKATNVDQSHQFFYFFDFKKLRDLGSKRNKLPVIALNPCLYKRR